MGSWVLISVNVKVISYFRSSEGNVKRKIEFMMISGTSPTCDTINYIFFGAKVSIVFLSDNIIFLNFAYFLMNSGLDFFKRKKTSSFVAGFCSIAVLL